MLQKAILIPKTKKTICHRKLLIKYRIFAS